MAATSFEGARLGCSWLLQEAGPLPQRCPKVVSDPFPFCPSFQRTRSLELARHSKTCSIRSAVSPPPQREASARQRSGSYERRDSGNEGGVPYRKNARPKQFDREVWTPSGVVRLDPKAKPRKPPPKSAPKQVDPGAWRLFQVKVPLESDPGKDDLSVHSCLHEVVAGRLLCKPERLQGDVISIVRKSFDARKSPPVFVYIVDVSAAALTAAHQSNPNTLKKLKIKPGLFERAPADSEQVIKGLGDSAESLLDGLAFAEYEDPMRDFDEAPAVRLTGRSLPKYVGPKREESAVNERMRVGDENHTEKGIATEDANKNKLDTDKKGGKTSKGAPSSKERALVVGSGPAGLFAALALAEAGLKVTVIERGQPVEKRGKDIGALMVRRQISAESNYCFGEGGAGTWSDGKLTTRIGKNSEEVREVLQTLVRFGGPERILVDGKPHLGTDRLVRLLRAFREHLESLGVEMRFGEIVDELRFSGSQVTGAVVRNLSTGAVEVMSAERVILGVGHSARDVYKMLHGHGVQMAQKDFAVGFRIEHPQALINGIQYRQWAEAVDRGRGKVPVADYSLAAQEHDDLRSCFSFCMCPGGQVVPTSTNAEELCVNGMSFSRRASQWANAALVVPVSAPDFEEFGGSSPLAGVHFQTAMERRAAEMGGGDFVAPVQRATDFMEGILSADPLPSSSYRLGVRGAQLDTLYPDIVTRSLRTALLDFDKKMPGFISAEALLHGVETRTSAPVRIERDPISLQSVSHEGLYPIGEGAGYAGGIVTSAFDGMRVGKAIARSLQVDGLSTSVAREVEASLI